MDDRQGRLLDDFADEFRNTPVEEFAGIFAIPALVVELPDQGARPTAYDTDERETMDPSSEGSPEFGLGTQYVWFLLKGDRNSFSGRISAGRSRNNDIVIGHRTVSKAHAYFELFGADWMLTDMASKNGTFLNGNRIYENHPTAISAMDVIRFGSIKSIFLTPQALFNYANLHDRIRKIRP